MEHRAWDAESPGWQAALHVAPPPQSPLPGAAVAFSCCFCFFVFCFSVLLFSDKVTPSGGFVFSGRDAFRFSTKID
jgi:hypothetical protein